MKREKYRVFFSGRELPVSDETDQKLKGSWEIHHMKENNAEGRKLTYVGFSAPAGPYSRTDDGHRRIICWYQDDLGEYWHEHRILVDGKIVSSFVYFFGEEKDRPSIENEHMVPKAYKEGQDGFRKENRAAG